jgi:hypothetical protein
LNHGNPLILSVLSVMTSPMLMVHTGYEPHTVVVWTPRSRIRQYCSER